jgi:hypothetical protein
MGRGLGVESSKKRAGLLVGSEGRGGEARKDATYPSETAMMFSHLVFSSPSCSPLLSRSHSASIFAR